MKLERRARQAMEVRSSDITPNGMGSCWRDSEDLCDLVYILNSSLTCGELGVRCILESYREARANADHQTAVLIACPPPPGTTTPFLLPSINASTLDKCCIYAKHWGHSYTAPLMIPALVELAT